MKPLCIGVAGGTGSGKSTVARKIAEGLPVGSVSVVDHDSYYRDLGHLPFSERIKQNFDDPDLIESTLLVEHVAALARGCAIQRPLYDFSTHTRVLGTTELVRPGSFVLVEGLFALYYKELIPLYQMSIYIDTPDEICFERRLKRDTIERGRTAESVCKQYEMTVRPSSIAYVRPSATHADLVLDGTAALDWKVEQVLAAMRERGLLRLPR